MFLKHPRQAGHLAEQLGQLPGQCSGLCQRLGQNLAGGFLLNSDGRHGSPRTSGETGKPWIIIQFHHQIVYIIIQL
jgi:hypothetical protein